MYSCLIICNDLFFKTNKTNRLAIFQSWALLLLAISFSNFLPSSPPSDHPQPGNLSIQNSVILCKVAYSVISVPFSFEPAPNKCIHLNKLLSPLNIYFPGRVCTMQQVHGKCMWSYIFPHLVYFFPFFHCFSPNSIQQLNTVTQLWSVTDFFTDMRIPPYTQLYTYLADLHHVSVSTVMCPQR